MGGGEGVVWISGDRDDRRIFRGRKILASIFFAQLDLSRNFSGYSKLMFLFFRVISFNAFSKILWLGNAAWYFWGVKFRCRDFFGF